MLFGSCSMAYVLVRTWAYPSSLVAKWTLASHRQDVEVDTSGYRTGARNEPIWLFDKEYNQNVLLYRQVAVFGSSATGWLHRIVGPIHESVYDPSFIFQRCPSSLPIASMVLWKTYQTRILCASPDDFYDALAKVASQISI